MYPRGASNTVWVSEDVSQLIKYLIVVLLVLTGGPYSEAETEDTLLADSVKLLLLAYTSRRVLAPRLVAFIFGSVGVLFD